MKILRSFSGTLAQPTDVIEGCSTYRTLPAGTSVRGEVRESYTCQCHVEIVADGVPYWVNDDKAPALT